MPETFVLEKEKCAHCGETCEEEQIVFEEKPFCCYGCRAVYELIQQSGLRIHFGIVSQTNRSMVGSQADRKYAFLDSWDIEQKLLRFKDEELSAVQLSLPGIHCSSCIYLLEHLPKFETSILVSRVNFVRKEINVTFRHADFSLKQLVILLSQLGYPPDISLASTEQKKSKKYIFINLHF